MEKSLPKGWVETTLGDVLSIEMGQSPPSYSYNIEGIGMPFMQGKTEFGKTYPTISKYTTDPKKIVEKGTILLSVRAPIGPTNVANTKMCIGRGLAGLSSKVIPTNFILYYLRSIEELLDSLGTGTTFKSISANKIHTVAFPLPPLPEQVRIFAKLDKLFVQHEKIKKALDRIPQLLKNFRQQVLTQAATGKLTEQWREGKTLDTLTYDILEHSKKEIREQNQKKHKPSSRVRFKENTKGIREIYELPNSWIWVNLDQVTWNVSDGPHYSPNYVNINDGKRFISMRNINSNGIDFSGCKYVSYGDHNEFIKRGVPETGDILYTKGGSTGIACLVGDDTDFSYWVHVALLKPVKKVVNSTYLKNCLNSELCYRQSQAFTHGVGNQDLGLTRMIFIAFPLPTFQEQQEIVRRVESLFAKADALEVHYQTLKEKVDTLPQTILHKAFKGELVPQLPTDGDAKDLLAEIMALKKDVKKKGKA